MEQRDFSIVPGETGCRFEGPAVSVGEINRHDGGRGLYFDDPDGHLLEVITRPYGSAG